MSDSFAEQVAKEKQSDSTGQTGQGKSFTLTITLQPNGELELSGPLNNKVLAFGLLGAAHSQLTEFYLKAAVSKQAASRGGINGLMKRMNGGN